MRSDIIKKGIERTPNPLILYATDSSRIARTRYLTTAFAVMISLVLCSCHKNTAVHYFYGKRVVDLYGVKNIAKPQAHLWPGMRDGALSCVSTQKYMDTPVTYEEISTKYAYAYREGTRFVSFEVSPWGPPDQVLVTLVFSTIGTSADMLRIEWVVSGSSDNRCVVTPHNFYAKEALGKYK